MKQSTIFQKQLIKIQQSRNGRTKTRKNKKYEKIETAAVQEYVPVRKDFREITFEEVFPERSENFGKQVGTVHSISINYIIYESKKTNN